MSATAKRWDGTDCRDHGGTGLQGEISGCADTSELWIGKCARYIDDKPVKLDRVKVLRGTEKEIKAEVQGQFQYIDTTGADLVEDRGKEGQSKEGNRSSGEKKDKLGTLVYSLGGKEIGSLPIIAGIL